MRKLIPFLLVITACGSSVTEEDLEPVIAPIVEAQELLENFENQLNAGLTYGDMLSEWPPISAEVNGLIDDIVDDIESIVDLPEVDTEELLAYGEGVAEAHDEWAEVVELVGEFIRDDGEEDAITAPYLIATFAMTGLDDLREAAQTPGAAPTTTTAP